VFKNKTYKQKNKYLLIGFGLMLIVAYQLAISETVDNYKACAELEKKQQSIQQAPQDLKLLQAQLKGINHLIENGHRNVGGAHAALVNVISNYCDENTVTLREYPGTQETIQNDLVIETNVFEVQGPFIKLLNLVYLLEQKNRIGKIASVRFESHKDLATKQTMLTVKIYIQNVKKNTHENLIETT